MHGPLVRAMRARAAVHRRRHPDPPTVLAVVYPAMDGRRQIVIKANGGDRERRGVRVVAATTRRARRGATDALSCSPCRSPCRPTTTSPTS
ncbi:hypothetical protein K7G98_14155 [Saccharothrix sp. MB29]|nr:hypothetical protein [Saccharothrix sp. MB29]